MPFKSLGTVSYSPSIVTMAVSVAVCEIFSVKEWCDLENKVRVRSRSFEINHLIDRIQVFAFHSNYGAILYRLWDIASYLSKIPNLYTAVVFSDSVRGDPFGISWRCSIRTSSRNSEKNDVQTKSLSFAAIGQNPAGNFFKLALPHSWPYLTPTHA